MEHARAELADAQATAEAAQVGVPIMSISTTSQLRAARAEVANALAGVAAAERQSAIAEAKLREAEANHSIAEEDLRRYERLLAKDAATRQQYDQALAQAKASAAAAVMLPAFMEILDTTVAAVSLPHIAGNLAATAEESTWVLTSYLISNAIVLPASGWPSTSAASDFSSPVSPFLPRPRVCAGASISLCMIIVARIFQGLGGGALQPISQAILLESFPTYRRGTAMAVLGLGVVFAPVIGPTLGGWITDNIPGGGSSTSTFRLPPGDSDDPCRGRRSSVHSHRQAGPDRYDRVRLDGGLASYPPGRPRQGTAGRLFAAVWIRWFALISAVAMLAFIVWELRTKEPIVNLRVFCNRNFAVGTFLITLVGAGVYSTVTLWPLFLQTLMGYTAMLSSLTLSPRGAGAVVAMPFIARLTNRVDNRYLIAGGFVVFGVTTYVLGGINLEIAMRNVAWPISSRGWGSP